MTDDDLRSETLLAVRPAPPARRRRPLVAVLWIVFLVIPVVGVAGLGLFVMATLGEDEMTEAQGVRMAGFDGATVQAYEHHGVMGDDVGFAIVGSGPELDRLLEQAEVEGPWADGAMTSPPDGPRPLIDPTSAYDSYRRGPGTGTVMRAITRAELPSGDQVLLVRATQG